MIPLLVIATLGVAASLVYYLVASVTAMRFVARAIKSSPPTPQPPPHLAVLKPLHGMREGLLENGISYLESGYPNADFYFAVHGYEDRALDVPVSLRAKYPGARITLVVGDEPGVQNRKIAKVIRMAERANGAAAYVMSDADISVDRGHLNTIIGELFADDRIGIVTCLYRAVPANTLPSRLSALFVNTDFVPMVLLSAAIEPVRYAMGATIAVRREALEAIGGFRVLGDLLADDYELGRRVADAGWKIAISRSIVTSTCAEHSFAEFWTHKLRWARTYRVARPISILTILINGPLWALVLLAATGASRSAIAALAAVLVARIGMSALMLGPVLKLPHLLRDVWLAPIKDLVMAAVWGASLLGDTVRWGGRQFRITSDGAMREIIDG